MSFSKPQANFKCHALLDNSFCGLWQWKQRCLLPSRDSRLHVEELGLSGHKKFNPNSTHWKVVESSHKLKEVVCIVKDAILHKVWNN
jgi:hypothetical protein